MRNVSQLNALLVKFNAQNLTHIHTLHSLVVVVTLLTTMIRIKTPFQIQMKTGTNFSMNN